MDCVQFCLSSLDSGWCVWEMAASDREVVTACINFQTAFAVVTQSVNPVVPVPPFASDPDTHTLTARGHLRVGVKVGDNLLGPWVQFTRGQIPAIVQVHADQVVALHDGET